MAPAGDKAVRARTGEIQDMAAAKDDELAVIFREMRRASERSLDELAVGLRTAPGILVALEAGNINALPDWKETCRIVSEYATLLHLDSRPVLRRLEAGFASRTTVPVPPVPPAHMPPKADPEPPVPGRPILPNPAAASRPQSATGLPRPPGAMNSYTPVTKQLRPAPPPPAPQAAAATAAPATAEVVAPKAAEAPAAAPAGMDGAVRKKKSRTSSLVTWFLLLAVFAAMALGVRHAIQHPETVWTTVDSLPEPAPQTVRSLWELLRPLDDASPGSVPGDPQSQKSDRLPEAATPQGN